MGERLIAPPELAIDGKLYLRRLEPNLDDMGPLSDLLQANAGTIGKFLPWTLDVKPEKLQGFARTMNKRAAKGEGAPYGIFERSAFTWSASELPTLERQSRLVGHVALHSFEGCTAQIGYYLDARAGGRGIMTRAARRVIEMGFANMELERIFAVMDPENNRSRAVMERLGAQFDGQTSQGEDVFVVTPKLIAQKRP